MLHLIALIVATILLALAAFGVTAPKVSLGWLGLAIFVASYLLH
jgi:hypothetical protein